MSQPIIIGLAGKRGVGKSEVAGFLEKLGFIRIHAFDGGKAAVMGYYLHIGIPQNVAWQMIYGNLKDTPSDYLPNRATSRTFMEPFGRFMGMDMGAEWTLGLELRRARRLFPQASIVAESIVYEIKELTAAGGRIIRVLRPGNIGPVGSHSDEHESQIVAEATIINSGTLLDLEFATGVALGQLT